MGLLVAVCSQFEKIMKATIKTITVETPRVLSFLVKPNQPVGFHTGQAMRWNLPGVPVGRLYSVACPGGGALSELLFTIRIFDDGKLTSHLRALKVGDTIDLMGPYGSFMFNATDPRDVGLIAGGSGISALRAIAHHVLERDTDPKRRVHLVFSVLNVDEIIYKQELAELAARNSRFTYTIVVTEPHPSWSGKTGFVTRAIFDAEFKDYQEQFYICGPQPFIECSDSILKEAGVSPERIHIDQWKFYPKKLTS